MSKPLESSRHDLFYRRLFLLQLNSYDFIFVRNSAIATDKGGGDRDTPVQRMGFLDCLQSKTRLMPGVSVYYYVTETVRPVHLQLQTGVQCIYCSAERVVDCTLSVSVWALPELNIPSIMQ